MAETEYDTPTIQASLAKPERKRGPPRLTLRDLSRSHRLFWEDSWFAQFSQKMADRSPDGTLRMLSGNELVVMALNEVAVQRGRGFFYHFKSKDRWKNRQSEDAKICPKSRVPSQPGSVALSETASTCRLTSPRGVLSCCCIPEFHLDRSWSRRLPHEFPSRPIPDVRWFGQPTA